jgi:hypothetical protein
MSVAYDASMVVASTRRPALRAVWVVDVAAGAIAILVIGGPVLFTNDGFAVDFTNHLWLVWVQEAAIAHHATPTYFVSAPAVGVFYPFFAFYGATLYATAGALAAAMDGRVVAAFVVVTLLGVAAAYGGLVWLSRQLGVRSWMAHLPAIAFVASAYYVTNLYGRGAWTEFMATSMIPLLIASGWRLIRAPSLEPIPAALFVLAAIIFAGSHNITLELGSLVILASWALVWIAGGRRALPRGPRRTLEVAALLIVAVAVNAWFLLPDVAHASETAIGTRALIPWHASRFFNTPGILFNPLRAVPSQSTTPALYVQAPDWFLAAALVAGALVWSLTASRLRRTGSALLLVLAALFGAIMIQPVWDSLPRPLREAQLPFRLDTYVALVVAGLVLVVALAVQQLASGPRGQITKALLAGAAAISVGLAVWQVWVPNTHSPTSYRNRDNIFVSTRVTPRTWYDISSYVDISQPVAHPAGTVTIPPAQVDPNRATVSVLPPSGSHPFATNISGGPYVLKVGGGVIRAGRTPNGYVAARRSKPGAGPIVMSLSAGGTALTFGRWISFGALAILLVLACYAIGNRVWPR